MEQYIQPALDKCYQAVYDLYHSFMKSPLVENINSIRYRTDDCIPNVCKLISLIKSNNMYSVACLNSHVQPFMHFLKKVGHQYIISGSDIAVGHNE